MARYTRLRLGNFLISTQGLAFVYKIEIPLIPSICIVVLVCIDWRFFDDVRSSDDTITYRIVRVSTPFYTSPVHMIFHNGVRLLRPPMTSSLV